MKQMFTTTLIRNAILISFLFIVLSCNNDRYSEIIDLSYQVNPSIFARKDSIPDFDAMLSSFSNHDNLYIMTFHGNFDELIAYHHQQIQQYFEKQQKQDSLSLHCSLFTYRDTTGKIYFGRNFDNRDTDVLIGLFIPDSGYTSIGFIPMIELKFDQHNPFDSTNRDHQLLLLHSAAVTVDGINEKGVVVSVASIGKEEVKAGTSKTYRFLLHLKRDILDHAPDLETAIDIAASYNIFDNSLHHISHHILIADSSGRSAVLEWHNGNMQVIEGSDRMQIVTNTKMFNRSDSELSGQCRRYNTIYRELESVDTLTWQQSMDILIDASQHNKVYYFDSGPMRVSTQWSAVFDITERQVFVCMQDQFRKVFRFTLHNKDFYQNNTQ